MDSLSVKLNEVGVNRHISLSGVLHGGGGPARGWALRGLRVGQGEGQLH